MIPKKLRALFLRRSIKKIKRCIDSIETRMMDDFLELLLKIIRLVLIVDPKYRRNIEDFNARYTFRSEDGRIATSAIFKDNKMKVKKYEIPDTNVTVIFKNGKALWEFLMAADPDVFIFLLENKVRNKGNINYLLKFGFMSKRLKFMFGL